DDDRLADRAPDGGSAGPENPSPATEVLPLPPIPGGAEDPAVVPLIPTWHPDDLPDDEAPGEAPDGPEDTGDAPERTPPDEPPPSGAPDDGGGGEPEPEDPVGGAAGEDPDDEPAPDLQAIRFDPVLARSAFACD